MQTSPDPPFILGLTGSIAMGKSTVLAMFDQLGVPTFSADRIVHEHYAISGAAVAPVAARFPAALKDGAIDRPALANLVLDDPAAMADLEAIVHPLVREAQAVFIDKAARDGAPLVVLEIPLLFETGAQGRLDATAVVSAPASVQRARALKRAGMTEQSFAAIVDRQMSDAQKRNRADYVIDTGKSLPDTKNDVENLIASLAVRPAKR